MTSLCVHVESFPDKMIFYFCLILTEYYKQKNSDEFCWCVYMHHWVVIWVAALPDILISPYIAQFMGCVISMKHCGLKKGYIYSSCYYHHQSEVSTLPIVIIFSVVVCLKCFLRHILSLIAYTIRENRNFVFIIIGQFMMSANTRIRFGLQVVLVYWYITPSHYHQCANLSEDIELIKCLSDIFCRVCEYD